MPPSWSAHAITWVMKPDVAWSGPSPVWRTHGSQQAVRRFRAKRVGEPVATGRERGSRELEEPTTPEPSVRPATEAEPTRRPQLGAEHAEGQVRVGHERVEHRPPRGAVPGRMPLELRYVVLERRGEERARSVGEGRGGREVGVEVHDSTRVELVLQLRVGGRAGPERMPRGEELVREPWRGQVARRPDAPAELLGALEHAHAPARLREERRPREGVDPGADEHRVEGRHRRATLSGRLSLDMSDARVT